MDSMFMCFQKVERWFTVIPWTGMRRVDLGTNTQNMIMLF